MSTVREVTYGVLRDLGMTKIFGNPGSSELPFLKDMPPDFQYVLGLHERTAAGMALGYAMARGEAAFVNLHSIASAGNGLSALIDAQLCHAPLVVTTGQQDRRQVMAEPFLVSRAVEVVKPYVKWACEPLRPEDVPAAIARGYHMAMQPPRGPVFISVPMDDWNKPCEPLITRKVTQSVLADPAALDEVVRAIDSSRKLALITGAQIEEDRAGRGAAERRCVRRADRVALGVSAKPSPVSRRIVSRAETAGRSTGGLRHGRCAGRAGFPLLRVRAGKRDSAGHEAFPNHEFAAGRFERSCRNEHCGQHRSGRGVHSQPSSAPCRHERSRPSRRPSTR